MPLVQSYHKPVFYQYTLGSGEVSSGYVNIYTAPYNVGNQAAISVQVYNSGGVDKTANCKVEHTISTSTTSGVIKITPSSPAYADKILVDVVYL